MPVVSVSPGSASVHSSSSSPHWRLRLVERHGVVRGVEQPLAGDRRVVAGTRGRATARRARAAAASARARARPVRRRPPSSTVCSTSRSLPRTRATPCSQSSIGNGRPVRWPEQLAVRGRLQRLAPLRRPGVGERELAESACVVAEQRLVRAVERGEPIAVGRRRAVRVERGLRRVQPRVDLVGEPAQAVVQRFRANATIRSTNGVEHEARRVDPCERDRARLGEQPARASRSRVDASAARSSRRSRERRAFGGDDRPVRARASRAAGSSPTVATSSSARCSRSIFSSSVAARAVGRHQLAEAARAARSARPQASSPRRARRVKTCARHW